MQNKIIKRLSICELQAVEAQFARLKIFRVAQTHSILPQIGAKCNNKGGLDSSRNDVG